LSMSPSTRATNTPEPDPLRLTQNGCAVAGPDRTGLVWSGRLAAAAWSDRACVGAMPPACLTVPVGGLVPPVSTLPPVMDPPGRQETTLRLRRWRGASVHGRRSVARPVRLTHGAVSHPGKFLPGLRQQVIVGIRQKAASRHPPSEPVRFDSAFTCLCLRSSHMYGREAISPPRDQMSNLYGVIVLL
jgi:hypothetical protein